MNQNRTQEAIERAKTALGIEFGWTCIKAVLSGENHTPIASGNYDWETDTKWRLDVLSRGRLDRLAGELSDP